MPITTMPMTVHTSQGNGDVSRAKSCDPGVLRGPRDHASRGDAIDLAWASYETCLRLAASQAETRIMVKARPSYGKGADGPSPADPSVPSLG